MTNPDARSLGRYQLLFMLGQGGMGEVHLARLSGAAGFEKLCIVKTVLPNLMSDQSFIDRFHHEARVLVQLTHSNIAQVYDMGEAEGTLYMAIEYVPGVDLSRVETRVERQQTVMPTSMAIFIGQKMCEALGYAHRKVGADGQPLGIVHRDVSPQNVMVSYEGEVKVIDFGLAKSSARSKHTLPSTVMGKLGYMSPEQAVAKPVDHRSDIFSAGIVIWEMLTGRSLYAGGTMGEMVAQMAVAEVPSLASVRADISPALDQVVMRALAKDPAARYQRADEFARALNELAVREQITVGAEEVGNYVRSMCPEEFAAERQLQSKLSVMRRKGSAPEVVRQHAEVEGTFLRASGAQQTPSGQAMTAAQLALSMVAPSNPKLATPAPPTSGPKRISSVAPVSAPDDEPIVVPKSKTPLLIAGLALIVIGVGAALFVLGPRPEPSTAPVGVVPAPREPEAPPEPVALKDPALKDPALKDPAPTASPPPAEPLERIELKQKAWRVHRREDGSVVLLERGDVLKEGNRVLLVSEEGADGKRDVYGFGAVLEVKGSLATVLFDEESALPEKVFAALDVEERGRNRTKRSGTKVASTELTNPKPAIEEVRREPAEPPTPAEPDPRTRPVNTVAPLVEPARPRPSESTPIRVAESSKPVEPIRAGDKLAEPLKVAEPAKLAEPLRTAVPEPARPEPAKPAVTQLYGDVKLSAPNTVGNRIVMVRSNNAFPLSDCQLRLPNNVVATLKGTMGPREQLRLSIRDFRPDARPADPQFKADWAAMYCREGTGYWKTTYDRR